MQLMAFAKNLKQIIEQRGLKLSDISKATGIPLSTLSEWTGGREPKLSNNLIKLCRYLGVSLDELVVSKNMQPISHSIVFREFLKFQNEDYLVTIQKVGRSKNAN